MRLRPLTGLLCALAAVLAVVVWAIGLGSPAAMLDPVAQAADATTHAGGAQLSFTGTVSSPAATSTLTLSGQGRVNFAANEGELTLAMSGLPASASSQLDGGSLTMTELFKSESLYIESSALAGRLPGGARWMKLDLASVGQAMGLDPSSLSSGSANPAQYLAYLKDGADTSSIVGHEDVRGVATTHYAGELNLLKAAEAQPGTDIAQARAAFAKLAAETGENIPTEVWVDDHDLVRKLSLTLTVATTGQPIQTKVEVEYYGFGSTPSVSAPSGSGVFDITGEALAGIAGQ